MEPRREDFPEQHVCENKFSPDQQLWNQDDNSSLEQEEPEPPHVKEEQEEPEPPQIKVEQDETDPPLIKEEHNELEPPLIKEEQEELCISQEGEQLVVKLEVDTYMMPLIAEENWQSEAEPNRVDTSKRRLEILDTTLPECMWGMPHRQGMESIQYA
ncbi:uncharacterized protein KZ484_011014 [Pholidichthys leucotaenia]